jgi:hypothetical protein
VDNPLNKDTLKNDMEVDLQNQSRLCKKNSVIKKPHLSITAV